jgi:hypothetical protein
MPSHDKLAPVRIERDTYAKLRKAAEAVGRTITEEVRQRLAASFERDADADRDPALAELQQRIGTLSPSSRFGRVSLQCWKRGGPQVIQFRRRRRSCTPRTTIPRRSAVCSRAP